MKSYGRAPEGVLGTLRDLRVEGERQAERALASASAAVRAAEAEEARLAAEFEAARAALAMARRDEGQPGSGVGSGERAADGQARRRFWARLEGQSGAAAEALAHHRTSTLARAVEAQTAARAAHVRARQRREVVDKAIARRQAAARLAAERREEAAMDDRATRARTSTPATGK